MPKFKIKGGKKLKGRVKIAGSKNAALPIICAALLTQEECTISNIPPIEDVKSLIKIIKKLGAKATWTKNTEVKIQAEEIKSSKTDENLTAKLRASILLMGPLLARTGAAKMIHPGGCIIGKRPIGTHFDAMEVLGVSISQDEKYYHANVKNIKANPIYLNEKSVTATENVIMLAVQARGKTIIKNAAAERHVENLAEFLNKMGAKILGAGTNTIEIEGVEKLSGAEIDVIDDEIEIGTFIALALATKSRLELLAKSFESLEPITHKAESLGAILDREKTSKGEVLKVMSRPELKATKIKPGPWPDFPSDLGAPFAIVATQARGTSLLHEWMFERRLFYIDELTKMGAKIVMCDPHRALISGPTKLYGTNIRSLDIRAGIAVVIAALAASGQTEIGNIELIDRGYWDIERRLRSVGADIHRIED